MLIFYRREIIRLLTSNRRAILPLIAATIPAGVIGVGIEKGLPDETTKWLLESPLFAGFGFSSPPPRLVAGPYERGRASIIPTRQRGRQSSSVSSKRAAILPGVSRSGLTISSGVGPRSETRGGAAIFVFDGTTVIGGAGLLKIKDAVDKGPRAPHPHARPRLRRHVDVGVWHRLLWVLLKMPRRGRLELASGHLYLRTLWIRRNN